MLSPYRCFSPWKPAVLPMRNFRHQPESPLCDLCGLCAMLSLLRTFIG